MDYYKLKNANLRGKFDIIDEIDGCIYGFQDKGADGVKSPKAGQSALQFLDGPKADG
jgi:hypothetical protein